MMRFSALESANNYVLRVGKTNSEFRLSFLSKLQVLLKIKIPQCTVQKHTVQKVLLALNVKFSPQVNFLFT